MFTELYQILKEPIPTLFQLFHKIEREGTAPNSVYKASVILIPNPDRDKGKKRKKNKPISLMNIDVNVLNKIKKNKNKKNPQSILKRSNVTTKWDSSWRLAPHIHINKCNKDRNHVIISADAEKAFGKVHHGFMIKIL